MNRRVALITGADRGIGAACVWRLAEQENAVAIHYHTGEKQAKSLAKRLKDRGFVAQTFYADLAKPQEITAMVQAVRESLGDVDILVNNAGIAQQKLFTELTEEDWDRMFAVNIKSMFLCSQAVLPAMIHKRYGRIVNLSSIWGVQGGSCEVHYSASKAAVIGFTKALAREEGLSGITVNCVAPGVIDTQMNAALSPHTMAALAQQTALGRIGTPKEVAAAVGFFASEEASYLTGQVLVVSGSTS